MNKIINILTWRQMKWSWQVNQKAVIDNDLDIDIIDLSIFEMFKDFTHSKQCKKMEVGGKMYYLMGWKLVVNQQPILRLNTRRSVTKRLEKLKAAGIIEPHPHNQGLRGMWYCWGKNYDLLINSTRNESTPLGMKVPTTRNESSHSSRYESSHNTIIDNNTSIENNIESHSKNDFEMFWALYSKKVDRKKCERKWAKIKEADKLAIFAHVPEYVQSTPDEGFRKNPLTYLNGDCWKDAIIKPRQKSDYLTVAKGVKYEQQAKEAAIKTNTKVLSM